MPTKQQKILVVDTDQFIVRSLTSKLQSAEIKVDSADQSWIAIEKLDKEAFDLVILEIVVPLLSGYEVLDFMKKSAKNKTTPVVILTNLQQDADIKRAFEYEILDYVVKYNVDLSSFITRAKEILEGKQAKLSKQEKEELSNKLITLSQQNSANTAPKIKILKCKKCEATLPPKTEFCPYCGTQVEESAIIKQNY